MGKNYLYFHDFFSEHEIHVHGIEKIIFEARTPYQLIQLVRSPVFGDMLIIDGDVQSTSKDEYIYHEALVHPAMILSKSPEIVFIIGGGEGATLREVLRHKTVRKAFMIDIDSEAVELAKKHLTNWHRGSFDDPRSTVINVDARKFLENEVSSGSCDVIISDLTEPYEEGPSFRLFTKEFFQVVYERLKDTGVFVLQASLLRVTTHEMHRAIRTTLKSVFPVVRSYTAYVPSFDTTWSFLIASKHSDPLNLTKEAIDAYLASNISGELSFYDSETHTALFNLPKDIRRILAEEGEIITDAKPLSLKRK